MYTWGMMGRKLREAWGESVVLGTSEGKAVEVGELGSDRSAEAGMGKLDKVTCEVELGGGQI